MTDETTVVLEIECLDDTEGVAPGPIRIAIAGTGGKTSMISAVMKAVERSNCRVLVVDDLPRLHEEVSLLVKTFEPLQAIKAQDYLPEQDFKKRGRRGQKAADRSYFGRGQRYRGEKR